MRKAGYYWIKLKPTYRWEIAYYDHTGWWVTSPNNRLQDSDIFKVGYRVAYIPISMGSVSVVLALIALLISFFKNCT